MDIYSINYIYEDGRCIKQTDEEIYNIPNLDGIVRVCCLYDIPIISCFGTIKSYQMMTRFFIGNDEYPDQINYDKWIDRRRNHHHNIYEGLIDDGYPTPKIRTKMGDGTKVETVINRIQYLDACYDNTTELLKDLKLFLKMMKEHEYKIVKKKVLKKA